MAHITENAIQILKERYLLKNKRGIQEIPEAMFKRVATFVSSCETDKASYTKKFYLLLSSLKFLPNSPTLMNAGCKQGQLSACFVLPVHDSLESIFTTLKYAALVHQSGGGTGFNFSKLRTKGDIISTTGGTSSGPVAFIKVYDTVTEHVKQGGKRRGANMGILNVDHPDIEEFIHAKSSKIAIENFNISVGITDRFMKAVENNSNWHLINPNGRKSIKTVSAVALWNQIVQQAWHSGDPGLLFMDTINKNNPTPKAGKIEATNPCGEVPLLAYESCNLGSINLSKMVKIKKKNCHIDWDQLSQTIKLAVRFLDNIITVNHYLISETKAITLANRKIGLGVMGWAELLFRLEIPYASTKAVELGEKLMRFIKQESYIASRDLAAERGTFPQWKHSIHASAYPMRNATCNSIAPTGTISVIANTSYAIEPLFALAYRRVGVLGNLTQNETNSLFVEKMKALGFWNSKVEEEVRRSGSISSVDEIPEKVKNLFKTSLEIPWQYHLLHQKAFQKYTDNAVSKTINLPENATVDMISEIFKTAWKYKLKGITVYRYGSKTNQILQKCSVNYGSYC
ncbi:MAG TPA: adenosylcobalamin-dependent ribonucleoside-diphosphate reductase [Flavobacteriaceae bacterium]|nr:adenosylcobalamin-dependent ribonucleoside-diphosphate reductase [Flavobacteriaceae bacterium]